jgi:hypothetical protein
VCETTNIKQWYILTFRIRTFFFFAFCYYSDSYSSKSLSSSVQGVFKKSTLLSFCWIRCLYVFHSYNVTPCLCVYPLKKLKLHGLSPRANYTDRAIAAYRRSECQHFADKGCHVVSVTDPYGRILGFLDRSRYFYIK